MMNYIFRDDICLIKEVNGFYLLDYSFFNIDIYEINIIFL